MAMNETYSFIDADENVLEFKEPFILLNADGFGTPDVDIQTQRAPFQDGTSVRDQIFQARNVFAEIGIKADSRNDLLTYRRQLAAIMNSKNGKGVFRWERNDGSDYAFDVVPRQCKFATGKKQSIEYYQVALCSFFAAVPFWRDFEVNEETFQSRTGGLEFPFTLETTFAEINTAVVLITNGGDVTAPITITITGAITDPQIRNSTTGKELDFENLDVPVGHTLVIDTQYGNKSAILYDPEGNGTNVVGNMTRYSEFWELAVGLNVINITSAGGTVGGNFLFQHYNRFVGM